MGLGVAGNGTDADFGGGAPARVVARWQQSTLPCMALVSCRAATAADGERLLTQCVREEHAAAFVAELDQLAHAHAPSYASALSMQLMN